MEKRFTMALRALLACICTLALLQSQAQTVADYSFTSFQGTYTAITGGQVLGTNTSDDQRFVDPAVPIGGTTTFGVGLPIGFNFVYAGNTFNRFAVNNNGWISLGDSALTPAVNLVSSSSYTAISATSTATPTYLRKRIAGLARDIQAQAGSELRYETIGTAPNRQLVVQWTNYKKFGTGGTGDTLNFQIVLNETSNVIQIVYGQMLNNATSGTAQVGLGGTVNTEFNNRSVTTDWTASAPGAVNTATCTISNTMVLPSGYIYQWTPLTCGSNTAVAVSGVTTTGATATWVRPALGSPGSINWQVVPQGNAPGVGVVASGTVSVDTAIISGLSPATYYTFYVQADCGANGLGNYSSANFLTQCLANNVPWFDNLETSVVATGASTAAPTCWANSLTSGTNWRSNTAPVRNGVGARSGTKYEYATWSSVAWLFTPGINLTAGTSYEFSFWYNNTDVTTPGHTINIRYGDAQAGANMTNTLGAIVNPTNTSYTQYVVNFTPASNGVYYFGLQDSTTSSVPWYLVFDDFLVQLTPPCPAPTAVSVGGVTDSAATITWTSLGLTTSIEYGTTGFTQGTGTVISGISSPYNLTGLNPQTGYSFYLTDSCNSGLSISTGPTNFTTLCSPYPYPGDGPASPIVVGAYPFTDTLSTTTDPCYTDASPLRSGRDIFLQFTADSCATSVTVSLCGSSFDTYLYIRDAANTTTIAFNDDACGLQSQYTLSGALLTPGATYLAVLEPFSAGGVGNYVINVTQTLGTTTPALSFITTPTSCPNSIDGGAEVLVTANAKTPLSYVWGGGETTASIAGLAPGDYFVTVTNGCGGVNSDSVTVLSSYEVYADVTNVACNAGNNGAIDLTLIGQTSPVFTWSGGETTEDIDTLTAGVYAITITDGACIYSDSFEVFEPTPLVLSLDTIENVSCFGGNDGSVQITVSGGTLNPDINGQLSTTFAGGNGCGGGNMFDLQVNTNLVITGVDLNLNTSGVVNFYVKPGTYQGFVTTPGAWTLVYSANVTTLGAGTPTPVVFNPPLPITAGLYGIFVNADLTYTNQAVGSVYVSPEMTLTVGDGLCGAFSGTNPGRAWNGNIRYNIPGDPYTYLWSNGDTTEDVSGVTANNYTVSVTDANSCSLTSSAYTITEPTALTAVVDSSSNVSCFGGSNGAAYITVSGGTVPYDYTWTDGSMDEDAVNLAAGDYYGIIGDANGCVVLTDTVFITEPAALTISVDSISNTLCSNSTDGAIYVTISGGTAPYSNTWSNGITFEDLVGVYPDTYTNAVTDANGCSETSAPITIASPPALLVTVDSSFNVTCNGGSNGSIYTSLSGATPPYTVLWDNGDTTTSLTNLPAGSYTPTITDANSCEYIDWPIDITEPAAILTQLDSLVTVKCNGEANGEVYISVTGGVAPYSVTWSNNATSEDITGLAAATYIPSVTDSSGCTYTGAGIAVTEPAVLALGLDSVVNVSCNGGTDGAIYVTVSGGTSPYSPTWSGGLNTEDLTNLSDGTYVGTITDANGCSLTGSPITVTEPSALALGVDSITNVTCNGGSNGCISITVNGGTAPYTVLWSNGSTTEDLCNLGSGPYTPTVSDANGCILSGQANVVTQPANALAAFSVSTDAVQGGTAGSIDLTPNGGTTPYTFDWSNGATTEDLSGLAAGIYTCTITDANGCSEVVSDTISLIIGIENVTGSGFAANIYPNPTQSHVLVDITLNSSSEVTIEVYNVNGQIIQQFMSEAASTVRFDVNFEEQAAGVYFVKIKSGDYIATKRVVVSR